MSSDLCRIKYHPECTFYEDGKCINQPGAYTCLCGSSTARHKRVKVEPDYEAAHILLSEILDAMGISASINAGMIVDAAIGIGELDGWAVSDGD